MLRKTWNWIDGDYRNKFQLIQAINRSLYENHDTSHVFISEDILPEGAMCHLCGFASVNKPLLRTGESVRDRVLAFRDLLNGQEGDLYFSLFLQSSRRKILLYLRGEISLNDSDFRTNAKSFLVWLKTLGHID